MKLYLIEPTRLPTGYDVCRSAVVAAKSNAAARKIHPTSNWKSSSWHTSGWTKTSDEVAATCIGTAARGTKEGIICVDFLHG